MCIQLFLAAAFLLMGAGCTTISNIVPTATEAPPVPASATNNKSTTTPAGESASTSASVQIAK